MLKLNFLMQKILLMSILNYFNIEADKNSF